jgi:hypothetical protein
MSGQIFISYRRQDSSAWAGRLSDHLSNHFPANQIFMDVDSVDLGEDFVKTIEETVGSCDVLIAVIGKDWLTSRDQAGQRRLDNPEDFVRIEIATALKRGIRVIPVLVDGVEMPRSNDLPDDLKALVRRNALQLSHERFRTDSERLESAVVRALEKTLEAGGEREEKDRPEAEQRVQERLEVERPEQKEPAELEHEIHLQPPIPVAPVPLAKPEENKASGETPKVVYPLAPKPAESKREKPWPHSTEGTGEKRASKLLIPVLTIGVVLIAGGLVYFTTRPSPSLPPQPTPASPSPNPVAIVTPTPAPTSSSPTTVARPSASIRLTLTREETSWTVLKSATKDHPWVNSLEMKFVPVAGTKVLFSVWDTRVRDFESFVKNTGYDATAGMWSFGRDGWHRRGATWKEPGFSQGPNHPVVGVCWYDAEEFCQWLTKRERSAGDLPEDREYRLPKDEEWSVAVGLKNEVGNTPEEKSGKINLYPWDIPQKRDKDWPPPLGAGNYAGEEAKNGDWPTDRTVIEGYNDGYPRTSRVGSFAPNFNGLYDMGGNVWQWCEDWYRAEMKRRVLRGGSWLNSEPASLLASFRNDVEPDNRRDVFGFRCVIGPESSR